VVFDDMSGPKPVNFRHGYAMVDWDAMDESDWAREAARMQAMDEDAENMKIRVAN
jgi:hypothetical protein